MRLIFVLSMTLVLGSFPVFSQGLLDKSKEDLKKKHKEEKEESDSGSSSSPSGDSFNNPVSRGIAQVFLYITYYAAIGNYEEEDHLQSNLTRYPFYNQKSGNYENSDSIESPGRARIDLNSQIMLAQNNIYGNHLKAKLRPFEYFYFQFDYVKLFEFNETKLSGLSLFSFLFCYDRLRFQRFNFGWMLGANYVANDVKKAGFSFGLNTDIFISDKVSIFGSARWGSINAAPVKEFELQSRYHTKRHFFAAGFEHMKIGGPTYNFFTVGAGIYF